MLSRYHRYYLIDTKTDCKSFYDIRPFLRAYCSGASSQFKNQITLNGDHLYLFHQTGDTYLFVTTRNDELVKKVDRNEVSVTEIADTLEAGEKIGYASYVHFESDFLAFGNTIFAPKYTSFTYYIERLFALIGADHLMFKTRIIAKKATKDELLEMPYHGRSLIEFPADSNVVKKMVKVLGIDNTGQDYHDLESIEITLKPKFRKSISSVTKDVVRTLPEDDYSRFMIKAKEEAAASATNYLIDKASDISDYIDTSRAATIHTQIVRKLEENKALASVLSDARSLDDKSERTDEDFGLNDYTNPDAWAVTVDHLLADSELTS